MVGIVYIKGMHSSHSRGCRPPATGTFRQVHWAYRGGVLCSASYDDSHDVSPEAMCRNKVLEIRRHIDHHIFNDCHFVLRGSSSLTINSILIHFQF